MKYEIKVETDSMSAESVSHVLVEHGIKVLGVKHLQYFFAVDLIYEGEMLDSIDILASSEEEAIDRGYKFFKLSSEDYDILSIKDITKEMIQIHKN